MRNRNKKPTGDESQQPHIPGPATAEQIVEALNNAVQSLNVPLTGVLVLAHVVTGDGKVVRFCIGKGDPNALRYNAMRFVSQAETEEDIVFSHAVSKRIEQEEGGDNDKEKWA